MYKYIECGIQLDVNTMQYYLYVETIDKSWFLKKIPRTVVVNDVHVNCMWNTINGAHFNSSISDDSGIRQDNAGFIKQKIKYSSYLY